MTTYHIQLKGHLDERWQTMFDGLTITHQYTSDQQPITIVTAQVTDQSALYGLLNRFRDLGVTLISVQPQEADTR